MTDRLEDHPRRTSADDGRTAASPVRPHPVLTLRCRTVATGRLGQRHHIRDLELIGGAGDQADLATSLSGDGQPLPSEMLLAALGACLSANIQANAIVRGIPVRSLEVHASGDVDPSALWGTGDRRAKPLGFQTITVAVHVDADVPADAIRALIDYAVLWSPVANTLHDPVHIDVGIVKQ